MAVLIVITRVPDIVVTLAMLFVWEGVALLILNAPGGTVHGLPAGKHRGLRPDRRVPRR
jgi:ribose/xylose/arabinose/galactoside ABC-type transport system permease subunit